MALAPFAEWRGPLPSQNYHAGNTVPWIGVTIHHMDGSLASADASFHDPNRGASAHFGIDFDGRVVQWVNTNDVAYAACQANWTGWVQIENASDPGQPDAPPTPQQIASMGQIIQWLGTSPTPATSPLSGGVGYHRQFGGLCQVAWGQTACPGQGFIDAIPAICAVYSPTEEDMITLIQGDTGIAALDGLHCVPLVQAEVDAFLFIGTKLQKIPETNFQQFLAISKRLEMEGASGSGSAPTHFTGTIDMHSA